MKGWIKYHRMAVVIAVFVCCTGVAAEEEPVQLRSQIGTQLIQWNKPIPVNIASPGGMVIESRDYPTGPVKRAVELPAFHVTQVEFRLDDTSHLTAHFAVDRPKYGGRRCRIHVTLLTEYGKPWATATAVIDTRRPWLVELRDDETVPGVFMDLGQLTQRDLVRYFRIVIYDDPDGERTPSVLPNTGQPQSSPSANQPEG